MTTWRHAELLTSDDCIRDISSHVFESEGTQHVFYNSGNDNFYELWWTGSETARQEKLAPPGRGPLTKSRQRRRAHPARILFERVQWRQLRQTHL